jgi:hypothetical protein
LGSSLPRLAVEAVGFATGGVTDPLTKVQLVSGGSSLTFERHAAVQAADSQATASAQTTAAPIRGWFSNFIQFVPIGVEHIVPGGLDHVLFVVGLSLRRAKFRSLMWQLAAFTVAHTLTLALATLGWVQAPAAVVEPLIAASIVAVALANLRASDSEQLQPRVGLCFGFGLIHGLGFAGALGQLGLQRQGLISALLGFNLGVELGQVLVAVSTLLLLSLARSFNKVSAVERWASVAIAFVGVYLLVDRV